MKNPYSPPDSEDALAARPAWGNMKSICLFGGTVFALAMALLFLWFSAYMLIAQANRHQVTADRLPPGVRASSESIANASWVLGLTSMGLALFTLMGLWLTFRKRYLLAWLVLVAVVLTYVIVANTFKPN